jgi:hypothetical protein
MLRACRDTFAVAIAARVPVPETVGIYLDRPDTAAGPCVWIEVESVTWATNVLSVNLRAVCLAASPPPAGSSSTTSATG